MQYRFAMLLMGVILASCGNTKKIQQGSAQMSAQQSSGSTGNPRFLEDITTGSNANEHVRPGLNNEGATIPPLSIELSFPAQFKYAILLDVPVELMNNRRLLNFMEEWWGTRYKYGGDSKTGIDCSAFTRRFVNAVYQKDIPRTSAAQYQALVKIKKKDLQEGDLVFFNTQRRRGAITHVGVYLRNNKFIHASTSSGVMISDLNETYFANRYVGAGRL